MIEPVMLDTGILGKVVHPRASTRHKALCDWLASLLTNGVRVIVPEIADYELRREFIRRGNEGTTSLARLNGLRTGLEYAPLTTDQMDLAAQLWAEARNRGQATAADKDLDGDAILAAQARKAGNAVRVITCNKKHLAQWVKALHWTEIDGNGNEIPPPQAPTAENPPSP
jgi:toxin FitB